MEKLDCFPRSFDHRIQELRLKKLWKLDIVKGQMT
jgi:hypothetical protein